MESHSGVIIEAVARLLRPLVRILLRHGVSCGAFTELTRRIYVEVAEQAFTVAGRKQSISRISVLTGLNRKEVARIKALPPIEHTNLDGRYNRAARVIAGWLRDARFQDKKGDPAALSFEGKGSFSELVKKYSGDMPPRAVADELLRVQAVELTDQERLCLTARGYVPGGGEVDKLQILGTDTAELIATIDHNLTHAPAMARFQRKVAYDNIPLEQVVPFAKLSGRLAQNLLEQLDSWLAEHDRDGNADAKGTGRARVGLAIYQLEEIIEPGDTDQQPAGRQRKKK